MKAALISTGVIALLAIIAIAASIQFPEFGQICQLTQDQSNRECTTYNLTTYGLLRILAFFQSYKGAITAIATGFIAAFTIILTRVGRRQVQDTRILQRAYIAVEGGGIDPLAAASVAHIIVRNVGHLPATKVMWFIHAELSADGRKSAFPVDEKKFYGNNAIPPGTHMARSQNFLATELYAKFRAGEAHIYVWGEIRYFDGFGEQRFTRFCHRYGRRGLKDHVIAVLPNSAPVTSKVEVTAESMRYHRYGNDAN